MAGLFYSGWRRALRRHSFVGEVRMAIFGRAMRASQMAAMMLAGALVAGCAGSATRGASAPAADSAPAFTTLDQSKTSHIDAARTVVVKDAAAWARLWDEHAGSDRPAPQVDFTTSMVVGVFLGSRPSGCHSTAIAALERVGNTLRVEQVEKVPGPTVRCMMMIVTPAHLVVTARSELAVEFTTKTREL
jgi:hypothetical protein